MNQLLLLVAVLLTAACSSEDAPPSTETPTQAEQPGSESSAGNSGPRLASSGSPQANSEGAGFEPLTSRDGSPSGGSEIAAPGVTFTLPAGWTAETPSSSMRLAQASIPGSTGDGQLTVFYFGPGGGGGLEANIQRWVGQMERDPSTAPLRDSFEIEGFKVTWIDVAGTLKPSTMGTGPETPQPGSRLLGGIVEGNQGPWYFKATGPAETLLAERDAFLSMLRSATPNG